MLTCTLDSGAFVDSGMEKGEKGKINLEEVRMITELKNRYAGRRKKNHGNSYNGRESQKDQERKIKTKKDVKERKN
jgi:hypothetical protein